MTEPQPIALTTWPRPPNFRKQTYDSILMYKYTMYFSIHVGFTRKHFANNP